ncbi:MAG: 50S ribosomal protein L9, partial [Hyphomicrobiaceae bacterium]
ENMADFQNRRVQLEARNLELKSEAEQVASTLEGKSFVAIRQAGDTGQLYGSVSTRDMSDLISEGGFSVNRTQIVLDKPIKSLGLHEIRVQLHPEVIVRVALNVARSEDEAERQARGEDVTVVREEAIELETFDPDAVFEEGAAEEDVGGPDEKAD